MMTLDELAVGESAVLETVGGEGALSSILTPGMALTFLTFCLLYTPCIAAVTSGKRENGTGWAVGMISFQCRRLDRRLRCASHAVCLWRGIKIQG